jgi:hypothetical protein
MNVMRAGAIAVAGITAVGVGAVVASRLFGADDDAGPRVDTAPSTGTSSTVDAPDPALPPSTTTTIGAGTANDASGPDTGTSTPEDAPTSTSTSTSTSTTSTTMPSPTTTTTLPPDTVPERMRAFHGQVLLEGLTADARVGALYIFDGTRAFPMHGASHYQAIKSSNQHAVATGQVVAVVRDIGGTYWLGPMDRIDAGLGVEELAKHRASEDLRAWAAPDGTGAAYEPYDEPVGTDTAA